MSQSRYSEDNRKGRIKSQAFFQHSLNKTSSLIYFYIFLTEMKTSYCFLLIFAMKCQSSVNVLLFGIVLLRNKSLKPLIVKVLKGMN